MRSLLSNMRVRTKMSIAAILLVLPLIYLSLQFFLKTSEDVSTRLEVAGVHFSAPLQRLVQAVQQRRSIVAGLPGEADADFKAASAALVRAVEEIDATQTREKKFLHLEIVWSDLRAKLIYLSDTNLKADRVGHITCILKRFTRSWCFGGCL